MLAEFQKFEPGCNCAITSKHLIRIIQSSLNLGESTRISGMMGYFSPLAFVWWGNMPLREMVNISEIPSLSFKYEEWPCVQTQLGTWRCIARQSKNNKCITIQMSYDEKLNARVQSTFYFTCFNTVCHRQVDGTRDIKPSLGNVFVWEIYTFLNHLFISFYNI